MFVYKSVAGVVNHKRLAINQDPGLALAERHPALDALVASGELTVESHMSVEPAVVEPVKNASPAAVTK